MVFLPLHIAVLIVLVRLFARKEADLDLPKCVVIFGVAIAGIEFAILSVGYWAFPLNFLIPWIILPLFFCVPWGKAAAVAASFLIYFILFALAIDAFSR